MSWATHISMIASNTKESQATRKEIAFADQYGDFSFKLNSLLRLTSIESLRFISEMTERIESANFEEDNYGDFNPHQKVAINSEQLDQLITDIDRFFLWCWNNTVETSKVFRNDGYTEDDIKKAIEESADYAPYSFGFDYPSGDPDFLFCTIKSMQGLLKFAKDNNVPVTYENLAEC